MLEQWLLPRRQQHSSVQVFSHVIEQSVRERICADTSEEDRNKYIVDHINNFDWRFLLSDCPQRYIDTCSDHEKDQSWNQMSKERNKKIQLYSLNSTDFSKRIIY